MPRKEVHLQRLPLAVCLLGLSAIANAGEIKGGALLPGDKPAIVSWGSELRFWPLDGGSPKTILKGRKFSAGCLDPKSGLYLLENQQLVFLAPPFDDVKVLETRTDFASCLPWTIDGVPGVLIPHLHLQLRFYSPTAETRELYSIYTPSRQGELLQDDVDQDGRTDLLWGNYWLRNPGTSESNWKLFAINTFWESEESALGRMALSPDGDLYWGASTGTARLVRLRKPDDPRQLWLARPLPDPPAGINALVFSGGSLFAAHNDGLVEYIPATTGFVKKVRTAGSAVVALISFAGDLWVVGRDRPRRLHLRK